MPRIFISAVTSEFGSARKLVERALKGLGYDTDVQEDFRMESGDLQQVLRNKIYDCEHRV